MNDNYDNSEQKGKLEESKDSLAYSFTTTDENYFLEDQLIANTGKENSISSSEYVSPDNKSEEKSSISERNNTIKSYDDDSLPSLVSMDSTQSNEKPEIPVSASDVGLQEFNIIEERRGQKFNDYTKTRNTSNFNLSNKHSTQNNERIPSQLDKDDLRNDLTEFSDPFANIEESKSSVVKGKQGKQRISLGAFLEAQKPNGRKHDKKSPTNERTPLRRKSSNLSTQKSPTNERTPPMRKSSKLSNQKSPTNKTTPLRRKSSNSSNGRGIFERGPSGKGLLKHKPRGLSR